MASEDLQTLVRWRDSGGTWRVLARTPAGLRIALLTCAGDEQMGELGSSDPQLLAYVGDAASDADRA